MRVLAVRVGHDQLVVLRGRRAIDRNVGDARGECAAHPEDLLVDGIAHPVRGVAQRAPRTGEALRRQAYPGEGVDEIEVHRQRAVFEHGESPDHHVVAPHGLPVARGDGLRARRGRRHALARQRAKAPAALEVVLHHARDVEAAVRRARRRERHDRDRDRVAHARGDLDLQRRVRPGRPSRGDRQHGHEREP